MNACEAPEVPSAERPVLAAIFRKKRRGLNVSSGMAGIQSGWADDLRDYVEGVTYLPDRSAPHLYETLLHEQFPCIRRQIGRPIQACAR